MNMSEEELGELMMSLMNTEDTSYDNNLKKLGYADFNKPSGIDIYPIDFESKEKVIGILDAYNDRMTADGEDDKVITYTDFVGTLMASVTDIVNMISYVLVAFVAISLVVSSIMIGVITYISVLERKKEIGILRSIGASKGDISRVFNAETIIVGFTAGVIGIGLTMLACIPANAIVYSLFDVANVASLPWQAAVILVAISVFLTFLAGLIPSSAASRKDPVGSAEKRVSEAAPHKPEQTEEALLFCKSASFPRQDERGGVFHRPSRLPRTLLWTFREIPDGHRLTPLRLVRLRSILLIEIDSH